MDEKKNTARILSLDVMRGITIAAMIMVNNPGTWGYIYAPLRHAMWNGLTLADLVFPFFMFIMGVSTYMSLRKYGFRLSGAAMTKIIRRAVVIFLIGLALAWTGLVVWGMASGANFVDVAFDFSTIRFLGVLPRLALAYGFAAIIALVCGLKRIPAITIGLLILYSILLLVNHGWEFSERNIIAVVDRAVMGEAHMLTDYVDGQSLKFDPEGLLATLPSMAHVLIGFMAGMMIISATDNRQRALQMFVLGTCLTFVGFTLAYGMPINKKIWSPTFVLTTCGLASLLLGLLIYIIDVNSHVRWSQFFEVFGANPLALYVLSVIVSIFIDVIPAPWSSHGNLQGWIFNGCLVHLCGGEMYVASLLYALLFVVIIWLPGRWLYRRHIYIKI